jgi:Protein of unknown function (DUF1257)
MSHVVCSSIIINDLDALRKAVARFPNLIFNEKKKTFNLYGEWVNDYSAQDAAYKNGIDVDQYGKCDVCIQMEGVKYEIGVVRRMDGQGWSLVWDNVGDGHKLTSLLGAHAQTLTTAYAEEYIRKFAERNGFIMEEQADENGDLMLTMTAV